jgi:hypothetical protein
VIKVLGERFSSLPKKRLCEIPLFPENLWHGFQGHNIRVEKAKEEKLNF